MSTSPFWLIRYFCIPVACSFINAGMSDAQPNFDSNVDLYNHARTLDLPESLPLFDRLVESAPQKYVGERAKMFAQSGVPAKALIDFNEAVRLNPNLWLSARASFFRSTGEFKKAQEDWQMLINLRQSKLSELQPDTKEYSKSSSDLARAYFGRGLAFESTNSSQALKDFKSAANLDLSFAENYLDHCEALKLDSDCLLFLNKLVEKDPEKYLTRRAEYFKKSKNLESALQDYNQAIAKSRSLGLDDGYSPKAWAYNQRSIYYRSIGDDKLAGRDRRKALGLERLQKTLCGFSAYPIH